MARLILVRHAESEANTQQVATSRPPGPPLTPYGEKQAEALVDRLSGQNVVAILTSNTTRARSTARPLATALGITPAEDEDLIEISCGDLDGVVSPTAMTEVVRVYDAWFSGRRDEIIPGGETYDEVEERMLRALPGPDDVPADGTLMVVAHGGSIRVAVSGLLGEDVAVEAGFLDNAEYTILEGEPGGAWRLVELGNAVRR